MSAAPLRIIVTTGPGAKSGIEKMTVAIEGVEARGKARHYTDYAAGEARIEELQAEHGPGLEVVRRTR